jgi:hypothetical protein
MRSTSACNCSQIASRGREIDFHGRAAPTQTTHPAAAPWTRSARSTNASRPAATRRVCAHQDATRSLGAESVKLYGSCSPGPTPIARGSGEYPCASATLGTSDNKTAARSFFTVLSFLGFGRWQRVVWDICRTADACYSSRPLRRFGCRCRSTESRRSNLWGQAGSRTRYKLQQTPSRAFR